MCLVPDARVFSMKYVIWGMAFQLFVVEALLPATFPRPPFQIYFIICM